MQTRGRFRDSNEQSSEGVRSILLSGAELARFKDLWHIQLFFAQDEQGEEEVELRSKSGVSVEPAVPFHWNRAAKESDTFCSSGSDAKLMLTEDSPVIVLKSRAVIQAEKRSRWSQQIEQKVEEKNKKKKTRAFSMEESSLNRFGERISKNDTFGSSRKLGVPLPLPLPPDEDKFDQENIRAHRRHLSIDLRASPAAKFLVQMMHWEAQPEEQLVYSRTSMGGNCYVPFKWEEAPGKPKSSTEKVYTPTGMGNLRLPPRLHQVGVLQKPTHASSLSPTSTLDHVVDSSSSSPNPGTNSCSSSSSDPNETRTRTRKVLQAILALQIWRLWTRDSKKIPKESSLSKNKKRSVDYYYHHALHYNSSWSPSPRPFWHRSTKHDPTWVEQSSRPDNWRKEWALQKIASGCNVVKRAVRVRWWSYSKVSSSKKKRKSGKIAYRPLLCSVDGDSTAFACSSSSAL